MMNEAKQVYILPHYQLVGDTLQTFTKHDIKTVHSYNYTWVFLRDRCMSSSRSRADLKMHCRSYVGKHF